MMTVLLLDGHNLLYRSFVSVPSAVVARDGRPINGVYGLVSAVLRLIRDMEATHAIAAFDVPDTLTFRHELYPAYQGHRGPLGGELADEFLRQTEIARAVLPVMNVPALRAPGFEADDIMATLALQLAARGERAILVSTDRDLLQLVRSGIEVLVPGKTATLVVDAEAVMARVGVQPAGVTTWKALAGDPSDNIPGVRGVGDKTAASLVNRYGSLEGIYAELDELPARTGSLLRDQRELAFLFRRVVTLVTDVEVGMGVQDIPRVEAGDDVRVRDVLERAGHGRP
jgi:DNA polymerase-1